jgi:hypothetical protein
MLAVPVAVAGLAAAAGWWAPAGARAATPTRVTATRVTATITRSRIVLVPAFVPGGPVTITVRNRTKDRRDFGLGARRTHAIAPGGSARLTVTVSGRGERQFSSVVVAGSHRLTAALHLFVPCGDPTATTVDVQIDKSAGGLTLSATTIPCGTVTFDVTDVDTPYGAFLISADAPPRSGATPQLSPGGTTTLTVRFPASTLARCGAVQVGIDGIVTVVGGGTLTVH